MFVLFVLAIAVIASLIRGGRFGRLAKAPLRWVWLLFLGLGIQLVANLLVAADVLEVNDILVYVLILGSQVAVIAWVLSNWQLPGLPLVALGLLLNAVVMAANGAMPVDPDAIAVLGRDPSELIEGKHVLMDETTRLRWLADIWPIPLLRSIISVGDVVLAAGLIPITHHLMTYQTPRERRRQNGTAMSRPKHRPDDPAPGAGR